MNVFQLLPACLHKPTFYITVYLWAVLTLKCKNGKNLLLVTLDLVLSIRAVTVLFRWKSLAAASVKTKISEEGGADVSASYQSYTGQEKLLFTSSIRLRP